VADPSWKQFERRVARDHGAERNRLSGSSGCADQSTSDSTSTVFYVEAKYKRDGWPIYNHWREVAQSANWKAESRGHGKPTSSPTLVPLLCLEDRHDEQQGSVYVVHSSSLGSLLNPARTAALASAPGARMIWRLVSRTQLHGGREKRIPVVALGGGNRPGYLVAVHSDDWRRYAAAIARIQNEIRGITA